MLPAISGRLTRANSCKLVQDNMNSESISLTPLGLEKQWILRWQLRAGHDSLTASDIALNSSDRIQSISKS